MLLLGNDAVGQGISTIQEGASVSTDEVPINPSPSVNASPIRQAQSSPGGISNNLLNEEMTTIDTENEGKVPTQFVPDAAAEERFSPCGTNPQEQPMCDDPKARVDQLEDSENANHLPRAASYEGQGAISSRGEDDGTGERGLGETRPSPKSYPFGDDVNHPESEEDEIGDMPDFNRQQRLDDDDDDETIGTGYSVFTGYSALTIPVENSTEAIQRRVLENLEHSRMRIPEPRPSALDDLNLGTIDSNSNAISLNNQSSNLNRVSLNVDPILLPINDSGHAMSEHELQSFWATTGLCPTCGAVKTHEKEKYGPFRLLRRVKPLTVESCVYKGVCLACHDINDVRKILKDPSIPDDLPLAPMRGHDGNGVPFNNNLPPLNASSKASEVLQMFTSLRFQLFIFIAVFLIGAMSAGIILSTSNRQTRPPTPSPTVSSVPSMAPTGPLWRFTGEVFSEIDSFGSTVVLNDIGTRMAVAAPSAFEGAGIVTVFERNGTSEWIQVGDEISGSDASDGMALDFSENGERVVLGEPSLGSVSVFDFESSEMQWKLLGRRFGEEGFVGRFGFSVALSSDGSRLIVGAPHERPSQTGAAYIFDLVSDDPDLWMQTKFYGETENNQFGYSVDFGEKVDPNNGYSITAFVGSPFDGTQFSMGGRIRFFSYGGTWEESVIKRWHRLESFGKDAGRAFGRSLVARGAWFASVESVSQSFSSVRILSLESDRGSLETRQTIPFDSVVAELDLKKVLNNFVIATSSENAHNSTGQVSVMTDRFGSFERVGEVLPELELGKRAWIKPRPSVSVVALDEVSIMLAIGFESVVSSGRSGPAVRLYELDFLT